MKIAYKNICNYIGYYGLQLRLAKSVKMVYTYSGHKVQDDKGTLGVTRGRKTKGSSKEDSQMPNQAIWPIFFLK